MIMKFKIALAQTKYNDSVEANLEKACKFIGEAAAAGASIVVFPEIFIAAFPNGTPVEVKLKAAQTMDSPNVAKMCSYAAAHKIWVVFGMYEAADSKKNYNTTLVVDDNGNIAAQYRKTHLYDAFSYKESDYNIPGDKLFEPIDTPFGKVGLMVCYEVRFPEVARYEALKGAELILMPTAWFDGEGKSEQLKVSVQARAMENTVFVAMCDMCGGIRIGESLVCGPLGDVIAGAGREEELLLAEIDTEKIEAARRVLPVLENRRPELY